MKEKSERVQKCIEETQEIREAIDKVSCVRDKVLLVAMGFSNLSSSESETDIESELEGSKHSLPSSSSSYTLSPPTAFSKSDAPSDTTLPEFRQDHLPQTPSSLYPSSQHLRVLPSLDALHSALKSGHYNWFEVVSILMEAISSTLTVMMRVALGWIHWLLIANMRLLLLLGKTS